MFITNLCLVSFLSVEVCPCIVGPLMNHCVFFGLFWFLVCCLIFVAFCFVVCSFQTVALGFYNFALPGILLQKATQSCCIPFEPTLFWKRTFDALKGCLHRSLTRFRKKSQCWQVAQFCLADYRNDESQYEMSSVSVSGFDMCCMTESLNNFLSICVLLITDIT